MTEGEKSPISPTEAPEPLLYEEERKLVKGRGRVLEKLGIPPNVSVTEVMPPMSGLVERWLDRTFGPKPGEPGYVEKTPISRRRFVKSLAVVGGVAAGYALSRVAPWLNPMRPALRALEHQYKRELRNEGLEVEKQEVALLYLFNGADLSAEVDGVKLLATDVAMAAQGMNERTFQPVNFLDTSTWDHSKLTVLFKALDKFLKDVLTPEEGRGELKKLIIKYAGSYQEHYEAQLDKFETYLDKNGLPNKNLEEEDLRGFFTTSPEQKGLGYSQEQTDLVFDLRNAYQNKSFTLELRERINSINEEIGSGYRIP